MNRFVRFFLHIVIMGFALSLTACSVALRHPDQTIPSEAAITTSKATASQCSAVDEKTVRRQCYQHTVSTHDRLCQPQSIPYARCRSQITTCGLGNTSPVQLFNCEQQRGHTSATPKAGALMSIGVNHAHHMSTGHTLYVEEVCPNPDGSYKLRVSHTNYDRHCHLEEDAWVYFAPHSMQADFTTGQWAVWGKNLPIQGFILREPTIEENSIIKTVQP